VQDHLVALLDQQSRRHQTRPVEDPEIKTWAMGCIMRGVNGDAVSPDRNDVGLLAGRQGADLIREAEAGRAIDRRRFEDPAHRHRRRRSAVAKDTPRLGHRPLLEEGHAHFGVVARRRVHIHTQRRLKTVIDGRLEG
jgi:hypothetical protein